MKHSPTIVAHINCEMSIPHASHLSWSRVAPALTSAIPSSTLIVLRVRPVFKAPSNPDEDDVAEEEDQGRLVP